MPDRYDRLAEILRLRDELDEQGQSDAADAAHAFAGEMIEIRQAEPPDAAEDERTGEAAPPPAAPSPRLPTMTCRSRWVDEHTI